MVNKDNKKSKLLLVIFIILIMITSVIGFFSFNTPNQDTNAYNVDYNGFKFQATQDNRWITNVNNVDYIFDNLPSSLEDINLPDFQITQNKVYLLYNSSSFNPNNDYNVAKLYYALQNLGIRPVLACINEQDCPSEYPIKSCNEEAFYFKLDNTTKVYKQDNCIIIQGNNLGINKIIDKIILKLIGVI